MTAKQENKLSMFLAVKAVCDRNTATIQTLPAFADGYTEFTTHVANIQTLAQNQSVDSTGLAADKQQLRKDMATAAAIIAAAVNAYANKAEKNDLAAQSSVTASDMTKGGRWLGSELVAKGSNEIPATQTLLRHCPIEGLLVTGDALHTQTETARIIVQEKGADYLMSVKGNQKTIADNVRQLQQGLTHAFSPSS